MKILEKQIQKQCLDYLRLRKVFCYKINNVGIKKLNGSYIPSGMLGIPDIIAHIAGQVVYIEIKTSIGKLSEHQKAFREQCERDSISYLIIRDLRDLQKYL